MRFLDDKAQERKGKEDNDERAAPNASTAAPPADPSNVPLTPSASAMMSRMKGIGSPEAGDIVYEDGLGVTESDLIAAEVAGLSAMAQARGDFDTHFRATFTADSANVTPEADANGNSGPGGAAGKLPVALLHLCHRVIQSDPQAQLWLVEDSDTAQLSRFAPRRLVKTLAAECAEKAWRGEYDILVEVFQQAVAFAVAVGNGPLKLDWPGLEDSGSAALANSFLGEAQGSQTKEEGEPQAEEVSSAAAAAPPADHSEAEASMAEAEETKEGGRAAPSEGAVADDAAFNRFDAVVAKGHGASASEEQLPSIEVASNRPLRSPLEEGAAASDTSPAAAGKVERKVQEVLDTKGEEENNEDITREEGGGEGAEATTIEVAQSGHAETKEEGKSVEDNVKEVSAAEEGEEATEEEKEASEGVPTVEAEKTPSLSPFEQRLQPLQLLDASGVWVFEKKVGDSLDGLLKALKLPWIIRATLSRLKVRRRWRR